MSKPSANLRLFVAIHPPPELARAMIDSLAGRTLPPHRLSPIEQLHMTVQFIGDTPVSQLDETIESVQRAAAGLSAFSLTPYRCISLPERGPARLIAAQTDAHPTLIEMHRRLVTRLARNVRDRQTERFRPHFTLCRFRSPARGFTMDEAIAIDSFQVTRIALMRSALLPGGAVHKEVAVCELQI